MFVYNLPPLIITPPKKQPWGENIFFTVNLDGGTITRLINDDFWFDLPPSSLPPPNKTPSLGGTIICYYQFRWRDDYPPHK